MSAIKRTYKSGDLIFKEGDLAQSLFIINRGAVSIRKKKQKEMVEVGQIREKEVLGELSFFDRKPRSASAIAVIETEVMEITFESLEEIYKNIPSYLQTFIIAIAERLRKANEEIKRLQSSKN